MTAKGQGLLQIEKNWDRGTRIEERETHRHKVCDWDIDRRTGTEGWKN